MTPLAAALLAALTLDLPVAAPDAGLPIAERLASYRSCGAEQLAEQCVEGDSLACLMRAAGRILDASVPSEEIYGELSGARSGSTPTGRAARRSWPSDASKETPSPA